MNNTDKKTLRTFFTGSFHQDWNEDYDNTAEVIADLMRHSPPEHLSEIRDALLRFIDEIKDDEMMADMLDDDFGCAHDPSIEPGGVRNWVESLVAQLKRGPLT